MRIGLKNKGHTTASPARPTLPAQVGVWVGAWVGVCVGVYVVLYVGTYVALTYVTLA